MTAQYTQDAIEAPHTQREFEQATEPRIPVSGDLVSREAAIRAMFPHLRSMISRGQAADAIRNLPTITPAAPAVKVKPYRNIRALWKQHGGSIHGPRVETWTIPEEKIFAFLAALEGGE